MMEKEIFPSALSIGVPYELLGTMNPRKLSIFQKAFEMNMRRENAVAHRNGIYMMSAVSVAIEHCFSKNPKGKYLESPIGEDEYLESETNEERLSKERNNFMRRLEIMGANAGIAIANKKGGG